MPPAVLGVSLLGLYLATLAPGLTWANGGSDGGDLITAAFTGGVPHPTGYPLYLLLARLFQALPAGSLAFRTNLMSAVFTALAAMLIYGTVIRHLSPVPTFLNVLAALAAGYCFGLAPLVWSQAVITEVYALQAFLVVTVIYLYSRPTPASDGRRKSLDRWRGLSLGLALGNHSTALLLVPMALLLGSLHRTPPRGSLLVQSNREWLRDYRFDTRALGRQVAWLGIALCLYLVLPIRALANPPVNWGNPVSLDRLWWIVSGEMYQNVFINRNFSQLLPQVQLWMEFSLDQLGLVVILLGLLGLILFWDASRLTLLTIWAAGTSLLFTVIYRPPDVLVYLVPMLAAFSIWFGIGVSRLAERLSLRSGSLAAGLAVLLLGMVLVRPLFYFRQVDASRDDRAESFGREVLTRAPANAILFVSGDRAIFALWYFHFALHERPDLVVLATEFLPFDWYQEVLRSTYPSLSVTGQMVYPETVMRANPQRMACHVQYTDRAEMACTNPMSASR